MRSLSLNDTGDMESGVYQRREGEYRRPQGRLSLCTEFPEASARYMRYIRGSSYHRKVRMPSKGASVAFELVPEILNPWDATAIATDFEGQRFGYLPAVDAAVWHDVVRAANRSGFSVWSMGEVTDYESDDGCVEITATITVPLHQCALVLAERFGLGERISHLFGRLDQSTRANLVEVAWSDVDPSLISKVAAHAADHPELTWPTSPPRREQVRRELPGILLVWLREQAIRQRKSAATRRAAERDRQRQLRRAEEAAVKAEKRQIREREADRSQRQLVDQVEPLLRTGWTTRAISEHLGVAPHAVSIVRRLTSADPARHNRVAAASRRTQAAYALDLQESGQTRREIANELSVSLETVAGLLRDAKFYAAPASDQPRIQLAQEAHRARMEGETKEQFRVRKGLSKAKSVEAWRDAEALLGDPRAS